MHTPITFPTPPQLVGLTPLDHLVPIVVEGVDAATFLQGQLTQNVLNLASDTIRLGGYCSAKGRLQASFWLAHPQSEQFVLITHASLLPAWLKRLQMFVLRAKVTLRDAREQWQTVGICGHDAAQATLGEEAIKLPVHGLITTGETLLMRLPDVQGQARWIACTSVAQAQAWLSVQAHSHPHAWQWLDTMSGIPQITASTVDQFVPQMINFEVLGGVDFRKGCYPGQEVVARSQYLGSIKRRLFLAHSDVPLEAGQEVFSSADPQQACGQMVNAAQMPDQAQWSALVELKLAYADNTSEHPLHIGSPTGGILRLDALPYRLTANATDPTDTTA